MEVEVDHLRGGDDFAAAHRLEPLEFMQGAMERVRKRALVAPEVGEDDHGGFQHAARLEDRIAYIETGFLVFDLLKNPFGIHAIVGPRRERSPGLPSRSRS